MVCRSTVSGPEARILSDMYGTPIFIHMKTTLNIDDNLLSEARRLTGIDEKTALVHAGLRALVAQARATRLAALGGKERNLRPIPRRRIAGR